MHAKSRRRAKALAALIAGLTLLTAGATAAQEIAIDCTRYRAEIAYFEGLRDQMTYDALADFPGVKQAYHDAIGTAEQSRRQVRHVLEIYKSVASQGHELAPEKAQAEWRSAYDLAMRNREAAEVITKANDAERAAWSAYETLFAKVKSERFAKQIAEAKNKYYDCTGRQARAEAEARAKQREEERARWRDLSDEDKEKAREFAIAVFNMIKIAEGVGGEPEPELVVGATVEGGTATPLEQPKPKLTKPQKEAVRRIKQRAIERREQQTGVAHDPAASAITAAVIGAAVGGAIDRLQRERSHSGPAHAPTHRSGGAGPSTYKPPAVCNDPSCIDPRRVPQADIFRRR